MEAPGSDLAILADLSRKGTITLETSQSIDATTRTRVSQAAGRPTAPSSLSEMGFNAKNPEPTMWWVLGIRCSRYDAGFALGRARP